MERDRKRSKTGSGYADGPSSALGRSIGRCKVQGARCKVPGARCKGCVSCVGARLCPDVKS